MSIIHFELKAAQNSDTSALQMPANLNDLYQIVDQYALNSTKILVAVGLACLIMLFAVREIFSWFMKTGRLSKQFHVISARLEQIEAKLNQVTQAMESETEPTSEAQSLKKNQFDIHH